MQPAQSRAPFVMFETRAEEDRAASIERGMYSTKNVDYAIITPAGSKDRVERQVEEWFKHLASEVQNERFPGPWLEAYRFKYKEWKAGRELPVNGTPILNWPVISPAQAENCVALKIMTVEDLAAANEEAIGRLGMGGRALQQHAKNFLEQADKAQFSGRMTNLEEQVRQLLEENKQLKADRDAAKQTSPTESGQPDKSLGGKSEAELNAILNKF